MGSTWYTGTTYAREAPPGGSAPPPRPAPPGYPNDGPFLSWTTRIAPYFELDNVTKNFRMRPWSRRLAVVAIPARPAGDQRQRSERQARAKIMKCPSDRRSELVFVDTPA